MSDVITFLREVRDPRQPNARHDLGDILFVALAATLCGAKTCVQMAEFGEDRLDELRQIVDLPHGAPSHDTFSRVFRLLDPAELATAFEGCLAIVRASLNLPSSPKGVVAIDGKSLRRGYEKGRVNMAPLMVGVFDSQTRLSIAQARAPGGAEISATIGLLKGLTLKGCTVTADSLHCTLATARAVRDAKAHYALGLKANRRELLAEVQAAFDAAADLPGFETNETSHGRIERRRASVLPAARVQRTFNFPDLAAVGRIEAQRTIEGHTTTAVRYLMLSKLFSPRKLIDIVRAHWSIENNLHWTLDVVFDEDDARSRKNYAPENLAVIRRIALNILTAHPSNHTIGRKMRRASWDISFFFELVAQMR